MERCYGMFHASGRTETVRNGSSERQHLEVSGTVYLFGINLEVRLRWEAERVNAVAYPWKYKARELQ